MKRLSFVCLLTILFACEGLPSDPNGLRDLANNMEAQQDNYEKAYDNWTSGDVTSTFTAHLDGNSVAFIEEHMTRGTSGRSINKYFFYDDQLFCFRENRNNTDSTRVEVEILFDPTGEILEASQKLDNQPVALSDYIASMAKQHGQTLRELTKDAPHIAE